LPGNIFKELQNKKELVKFHASGDPKVPGEDVIMIGAQLCEKYQLHPSELLGEETTEEEERLWSELTNKITNAISRKKSARK